VVGRRRRATLAKHYSDCTRGGAVRPVRRPPHATSPPPARDPGWRRGTGSGTALAHTRGAPAHHRGAPAAHHRGAPPRSARAPPRRDTHARATCRRGRAGRRPAWDRTHVPATGYRVRNGVAGFDLRDDRVHVQRLVPSESHFAGVGASPSMPMQSALTSQLVCWRDGA